MKLIVRAVVVALVFTGVAASTQITSASAKVTIAKNSAMPTIPMPVVCVNGNFRKIIKVTEIFIVTAMKLGYADGSHWEAVNVSRHFCCDVVLR
jgi:hypothetical protein